MPEELITYSLQDLVDLDGLMHELSAKIMTQDERWYAQWKEIMDFMAANKRRPSKFVDEERGMRNWWKHQQKLMNAGELKGSRIEMFLQMLEVGERYRRVNQWG